MYASIAAHNADTDNLFLRNAAWLGSRYSREWEGRRDEFVCPPLMLTLVLTGLCLLP